MNFHGRFVWIENVKSFSGHYGLKNMKMGKNLWLAEHFGESRLLWQIPIGERVYHMNDLESVVGISYVESAPRKFRCNTKAIRRVVYLESFARGIKLQNSWSNIHYMDITLNRFRTTQSQLDLKRFLWDTMLWEYFAEHGCENKAKVLANEIKDGSQFLQIERGFWLKILAYYNNLRNLASRQIDTPL